jgi:hypothetical protein
MLRRRGTYKEGADQAAVSAAFEKHLRELYAWMEGKPYVKSLRVPYHDALHQTKEIALQLEQFLGIRLNIEAMVQQVDGSLYRNRGK